ncbi:hypothetical protein, partial [Nocardia veterana]
MATRTPWSEVPTRTDDSATSSGTTATPSDARRPVWGYVSSAVLSAGTFALLFQPWLSASGPGGSIRSDAFGRVDGATQNQPGWEGSGLADVGISGTWGVLTCVAVLATIFAAGAYLRTRVEVFSHATAAAASAVAVFVLANVLYLNGKESQLRLAVERNSGFSGMIRTLFGGAGQAHQVAAAQLDFAALLAGITAFGAAASVLMTYLQRLPAARALAPAPESAPAAADAEHA